MILHGGYTEKDTSPSINLHSTHYTQKKDVLGNRGSLGRMQKVCIFYVPTERTTTSEIKGVLEKRIYNFSCHLITYGFDVRVDLFCDQSTRFDRAAWSDHELSQADWIIFVCSRSSYELLQLSNSSEYSLNTSCVDREMRNIVGVLRKIIYNRLSINSSTRVIPVILLEEDNHIAFVPPSLQDPNNILCIFEDTPFDYNNLGGSLERLICRMAGINRVAINTSKQHREYVKLPSQLPKYIENPVNRSHSPIQCTYRCTENVAMRPTSHQSSPQQFCHQHHPPQQNFSFNYTSTQQSGQYVYHKPHCTNEFIQHPTQPQSYPSNNFTRKETGVTHSPHIHMSNYTQDPYNINHFSSEQLNRADGLSDHRVPHNSPILWELSLEVREWKFLARNLDLEERVIEEIDQYTIPNKMRDKSLKVFTEWVNSASRPSWKALGEALLEAEYTLLYEKLLELVKSHAV